MKIKVVGIPELPKVVGEWKPDYVISLLNKNLAHKNTILLDKFTNHHRFYFDDIEEIPSAYGPTIEDVESILSLTKNIPKNSKVLVHCHAGISRSTAIALAILIQHGVSIREAVTYLLKIRPIAKPNRLILWFVERVLGLPPDSIVKIVYRLKGNSWPEAKY